MPTHRGVDWLGHVIGPHTPIVPIAADGTAKSEISPRARVRPDDLIGAMHTFDTVEDRGCLPTPEAGQRQDVTWRWPRSSRRTRSFGVSRCPPPAPPRRFLRRSAGRYLALAGGGRRRRAGAGADSVSDRDARAVSGRADNRCLTASKPIGRRSAASCTAAARRSGRPPAGAGPGCARTCRAAAAPGPGRPASSPAATVVQRIVDHVAVDVGGRPSVVVSCGQALTNQTFEWAGSDRKGGLVTSPVDLDHRRPRPDGPAHGPSRSCGRP